MNTKRLDGKSKLVIATAKPKELKKYPMLVGNAAIVSTRVLTEGLLTSAVVEQLPEVVIPEPLKPVELDDLLAELSLGFSASSGCLLDSRGIVPVGTLVKPGMPLVAGFVTGNPTTPEEKLLRAFFSSASSRYARALLQSPFADDAVVVNVEVEGTEELRVRIELLVRRLLAIGDVLDDGHGNRLTVAGFGNKGRLSADRWGEVDVLVHPSVNMSLTGIRGKRVISCVSTMKLVKVTQRLEDKLLVRCIGHYNLVSGAPSQHLPKPGQKVNGAVVAAAGYVCNTREILTVKSDAVEERGAVYEALATGKKPVPNFGDSEAKLRFSRLMLACGFTVTVDVSGMRIVRTADEDVRKTSRGEVTQPETIHFRSFKPEKDGLFCARIFGPVTDWECSCGRYRRMKHRGMVCDRCGVEVARASVRRERFGHVELAVPVVHPWLIHLLPSILGLTEERVRGIINCEEEVVVSQQALTGAEAITRLLEDRSVDSHPFVMKALPVLPPDLRPLVPLGNGKWVSSDLNDLYRRVVNRSNRVKKLQELHAPEYIVRNESRMLQEGVSSLVSNSTLKGVGDRVLRSLDRELFSLVEDFYSKRADYSARAVCVPDPALEEGILGVPELILVEMFKPMIYRNLEAGHVVSTIKRARELIEDRPQSPEVLTALDEVIENYPVLAVSDSGAVAGFRIQRREGEAIFLHPHDAERLGIDFAGQGFAIHLPLSEEAREEAWSRPSARKDMDSMLSALTPARIAEYALAGERFLLGGLDRLLFAHESAQAPKSLAALTEEGKVNRQH